MLIKMLSGVAVVFTVLCLSICSDATDPRPTLPQAPLPDVDNYTDSALRIDRQHAYTCYIADCVMRANRPAYPDSLIRQAALFGLDEAFHYTDPDSGKSPAILEFLRRRTELAAFEMENTKVTDGVVIWKLYNHAFVVRTASVTFAIDLTRGQCAWWEEQALKESTMRIVGQCDALFISHEHGDHYDRFVIEAFKAQDKQVILPGSLERDGNTKKAINLSGNRKLQLVTYPGYQGDLANDVRIIYTPEGMSFAHTGDFQQKDGTPIDMYQWVDKIKDKWNVDVLMINIWASKFSQTVEGFGANLVIPGHENEIGHGNFDRKPYWQSYEKIQKIGCPFVVMAWGESYYVPLANDNEGQTLQQ